MARRQTARKRLFPSSHTDILDRNQTATGYIEPALLRAQQKVPYTYKSHYHENMVIFLDGLVMTEQDSLLSLNMDSA
jgi:hypothetical protein